MANLSKFSKVVIFYISRLAYFVLIAGAISFALSYLSLNRWINSLFIFLGTKLIADGVKAIFGRSRRFLYLEDYLRELLVYTLVAVLAIGLAEAIIVLIGGRVWMPLLAAAMVMAWQHSR